MRKSETVRPADEALDARLSRFGFGDPWDSWMDRIRELEWPRTLGSIGPYELLGEAGRGGQGIVCKARLTTTGRIVALKRLVGGSFASAESRRRLEREMEAAAVLSGDAIVRVLGVDLVDGQPLLAMEWVEGEPITAWARGRRDDPPAVLAVFLGVCDAVHHAHQRGVLHRDLKPSNLFVDREGRPRILDFGLAKLAEPGGEALTRTEQVLGTPGYAAPEQLGTPAAGDVRSDVYALGVVLFEMLTGSLPFPRGDGAEPWRTPGASPLRPSRLNPGVGAPLEAIALRAIEFDPERRYQSAGALAADVRRFLAGEPVEAQGPSAAVRARRFLRRHRVAAAFVGTVSLLVTGWGVVAGVLAYKLAGQTESARAAAQRTARINDFLIGLLGTARPTEPGADAGMLVAVDRAGARVDGELGDDPLVCAGVHAAIGRIYVGLRMTTPARRHLERAVGLRRAAGATDDGGFVEVLADLGAAMIQSGDPRAVEVEREALDRATRLRAGGAAGDADRLLALGIALVRTGVNAAEGEGLVRRAVERLDTALGPDDARSAAAHVHLGALLHEQGEHAAALDELDRAAAVLAPVCDDDSEFLPALVACAYTRANALLAAGRASEALATLLEAMPAHHCLYGGTRDGEWLWRWAMMGHADGRTGTIEKAHEALAAAWRHAEPPVGPFAGSEDWGAFFAGDPLHGATPGEYTRRVREALAKLGEPPAAQGAHAAWLAARLGDAGFPEHARAIGELSRTAGSPWPAPLTHERAGRVREGP